MANMSYCRFQNTLNDLLDCQAELESMAETGAELSVDEMTAMEKLIGVCKEIAENAEGLMTDWARAKEVNETVGQLEASPWAGTPSEDGIRYSTEASSLQPANMRLDEHNCPQCGKPIGRMQPIRKLNEPGEITHWTKRHSCGALLTIFND